MNLHLCPYIRRAWYNILRPGEQIGRRVIFDYELMFVKAGHAQIIIGDDTYQAGPGDMFIFRPRQTHSICVAPDEELIQPHIHFDLIFSEDRADVPVCYSDLPGIPQEHFRFFREDVLDSFFSPFPSFLHPHNGSVIEQMLFDIIHAVSNPRPFNDVYLEYSFLKLWEQILLEASYSGSSRTIKNGPAALIRQFIEQNDSQAISLQEISCALHFSKSYISRVFQDAYGISPIRYHTTLRVQKAKQMIRFTNLTLSEIAASLGFDSLQDFSRVFKKTDGRMPSGYRRPKA